MIAPNKLTSAAAYTGLNVFVDCAINISAAAQDIAVDIPNTEVCI
jgi:hypothetical protein